MWIKQKKNVDKKVEATLTFREKGLGLNKIFSSEYDIKTGNFCELFFSDDGSKIGLKFDKKQSEDSYTVGADGGNKGKTEHNSLFIACGTALKKSDVYVKLCNDKTSFPIFYDKSNDMYYVNILGKFIYNTTDRNIKSNEKGVYRYLSEGEIVYIGQGDLKSRLSSDIRTSWIYDKIEYMLIDDEIDRHTIESDNINLFTSINGRLPIYNRIKGRK